MLSRINLVYIEIKP